MIACSDGHVFAMMLDALPISRRGIAGCVGVELNNCERTGQTDRHAEVLKIGAMLNRRQAHQIFQVITKVSASIHLLFG